MQTQAAGMSMSMGGTQAMRWLPPELINTVWEFLADPSCRCGASLHGRRFPAEAAPTTREIGCGDGQCRCKYRVVA